MAINISLLRKIQIRRLSFDFCLLLTAYVILFTPVVYSAQPTQVCFKDKCVKVEVADTEIERARGLQGRNALDIDRGMLFIFPRQDVFNFWMKDTLIALDMIWINDDLQVVDIKENVPPCQTDPCEIYAPQGKAVYVLEINAQGVHNNGIKIGDRVVFK